MTQKKQKANRETIVAIVIVTFLILTILFGVLLVNYTMKKGLGERQCALKINLALDECYNGESCEIPDCIKNEA